MQIIQSIDEKTLFFFQNIRLDALTAFFSIFIKLQCWHVIAAILIGISRIYFGVHYPSDVMAGLILGTIVGILSLLGEKIILRINT